MSFEKERAVFEEYIRRKNLKHSERRLQILETFLKSERHLTIDELYAMVKKMFPGVGYATIYRTLRLLCESGMCRELKLEDGITRYEHLYGHKHHDHLVCERCGRFIEVFNPEIERIQVKLARDEGFTITRHRLEIYGHCKRCRTKR